MEQASRPEAVKAPPVAAAAVFGLLGLLKKKKLESENGFCGEEREGRVWTIGG